MGLTLPTYIQEVVVAERRTLRAPFPASTLINRGDLLWWDNTNKVGNSAGNIADQGSVLLNQQQFTPIFLGVAADQRLLAETDVTGVAAVGPGDRTVITEGIFDCPCASATFEFGDLVGIARTATPLNNNGAVVGVAEANIALGFVLKREPVATTIVRCYLSSFSFGWFKAKSAAAIGYLPGDGIGGAVTQITSRSTGVTLNTLAGQITGINTSLAANGFASFVVTNSQIGLNDGIVLSVQSGPTANTSIFTVSAVTAGSFTIKISNISTTTADTGTPILNFEVIKGAAS